MFFYIFAYIFSKYGWQKEHSIYLEPPRWFLDHVTWKDNRYDTEMVSDFDGCCDCAANLVYIFLHVGWSEPDGVDQIQGWSDQLLGQCFMESDHVFYDCCTALWRSDVSAWSFIQADNRCSMGRSFACSLLLLSPSLQDMVCSVRTGWYCHFTTDEQWKAWRKKYIIPAMWISVISFGLVHLRAFSVMDWQVLPFAFATILIPTAGGCAVTYARVNLGFWWGVLFHSIINIPSVLVIASAM